MDMNNPAMGPDHDEVRMLLPWHLNGTLPETEASLVRAHLESCSDCRADFAVHERMRLAVSQDEATPIVPTASANTLLDRLARRESEGNSWSRHRKYAVAASLVLAALIAVVAVTTDFGPVAHNQTFQTATNEQTDSRIGYVLRLRFEAGISSENRNRVIDELGGADIRGLQNAEAYEMLIHLPNSSLDELEQFAKEAQSRSEVTSAEFVALQLPVR
jgi:hypothetical protein